MPSVALNVRILNLSYLFLLFSINITCVANLNCLILPEKQQKIPVRYQILIFRFRHCHPFK